MTPPLTLTFTFTRELRRACASEFNRLRMGIPVWAGVLLLGAALSGLGQWLLSRSLMRDYGLAERWAAAISAVGVLFLVIRAKMRPVESAEEAATLRFTEDGMDGKTNLSESKTAWGAFRAFKESRSFFFLLTSDTHARAIPKDAFASAEEQAGFRSFLESKVPRAPDQGHPILGKTRPVIYLLLFSFLGILMYRGRAMMDSLPEITEAEFLRFKAVNMVSEVGIRTGELRVRFEDGYVLDGREYKVVRLLVRTSQDTLDRLLGDLPPGMVRDER